MAQDLFHRSWGAFSADRLDVEQASGKLSAVYLFDRLVPDSVRSAGISGLGDRVSEQIGGFLHFLFYATTDGRTGCLGGMPTLCLFAGCDSFFIRLDLLRLFLLLRAVCGERGGARRPAPLRTRAAAGGSTICREPV